MSWFMNFITSSLGKKLIMSLTGLFLITFLVVHLLGNFQLLYSDGGQAFNEYAHFMKSNPLIKVVSYGFYALILLHAFLGMALWVQNRKATAGTSRYAVNNTKAVDTNAGVAKSMAILGSIIFLFLIIHMYQFWLKMQLDLLPMVTYEGEAVPNLYDAVFVAFTDIKFVVFYVVCMVFLALHLKHGFWSAFQSLGINHKKYTPLIKFLGMAYSILIPLGFIVIPVWFYIANS